MSQMPAFGRDQLLKPAQVADLTEYVVALSGRKADAAAVARATTAYAEQLRQLPRRGRQGRCSPGRARPDRRRLAVSARIAPRLPARSTTAAAASCRRGATASDPETIKAIAVYIHANSGRSKS
jgi:cytochrome c oxidase cbb3-type subunit 3